jgi:hypothetical protein
MRNLQKRTRYKLPKMKALVVSISFALMGGGTWAGEHQLSKINFDATRNVDVLDMVMSIDWDFDNPPEGRDKAFIEGILRQASQSTFTMTEGRQMLGKVYVYKNSQFMSNTDIQYLLKDGRANAHMGGYTKGKTTRVQQFAGTGETPEQHGKTVAHEFGHYVLALADEYREVGGTSTWAHFPQDGDTPRDTMMHNHLLFANLSTADDYSDQTQRKTAQFRVYGKSAWEVITSDPSTDQEGARQFGQRILYDSFKNMTVPASPAALTKPTTGWESSLQVVYMGDAGAAATSQGRATGTSAAAASGPINAIVIDTTTSAANLTAQLHAAAQIIDKSGSANRVIVYAHPYSSAPVVPLTLLNSDAAKTSVKATLATIASDSSTDQKVVGDRLFAWAESVLPALFPSGPATIAAGGFHYRLYSTGRAIGVSGGKLFYYDGTQLADLGPTSNWLSQARSNLSASLTRSLDNLKSVRKLSDTPTVTLFTTSTQTVDSTLVAAFRKESVSVNPVALILPSTAGQPRLRSVTTGQTSLFELANGTFGVFKEASKPSELARSAGNVADTSEGDNAETVNTVEVETLAAGASHTMTSTVAGGGLDGQTVFHVYWSEEDAGKLSFTLTTPGGTVVTPTSLPAGITYKADAAEGEASYTVSANFPGLAGVWSSKLTAASATVDTVVQEVVVASSLSAGVDVTGGTNADPSPLKIVVDVSGPVAVTGATVKADVNSLTTGTVVRSGLTLLDNGVAPDMDASDGRYSISLADLPAGEYEITVTATNNGTAVYTTAGTTKMGVNKAPEAVPAFQRVTTETFVKER